MTSPEPQPPPLPPTELPPDAAYKVDLDVYSGPLELLLYLIRKEEVDIKDIPIAHITTQYLKYVDVIRKVDINLAGEFLVMAATLMEIKSRMLIPKPKPAPGAEGDEANAGANAVEELGDPRYELVQQLLAYKQFKDAAGVLKRRAENEAARFPRAVSSGRGGMAPLEIEDLNLFKLIDAFNAIMASLGHSAFGHEVVYDDTPISLHQADILDRLTREGGPMTLQAMFVGRKNKGELIGLFLAMLELIRQKKLAVEQPEPLGDLRITLREGAEDQVLFAEPAPAAETAGADPATETAPEAVPEAATDAPTA